MFEFDLVETFSKLVSALVLVLRGSTRTL
jgi:hypothetical protein